MNKIFKLPLFLSYLNSPRIGCNRVIKKLCADYSRFQKVDDSIISKIEDDLISPLKWKMTSTFSEHFLFLHFKYINLMQNFRTLEQLSLGENQRPW